MNRTRMDEEKMGSEARWNTVRRELKDRSSRVHVTSLPPYAPLSSSLRSAWSSFPRSLRFPRHLHAFHLSNSWSTAYDSLLTSLHITFSLLPVHFGLLSVPFVHLS